MEDLLRKDLEKALKKVRKHQKNPRNISAVRSEVGQDALEELARGGYIRCAEDFDEQGYGTYVKWELTPKGRGYWREKRRNALWRVFPPVAASLLGYLLGFLTGVNV